MTRMSWLFYFTKLQQVEHFFSHLNASSGLIKPVQLKYSMLVELRISNETNQAKRYALMQAFMCEFFVVH